MGRFEVVSNALAVAGDRLVAIVSVEPAGAVMVRDLANGRIHAACASAELIDQAAANGIYKLAPLDSETQGS